MTEIIKRVTKSCYGCMGASFPYGDCKDCDKVIETKVVMCHDCKHKAKNVMERKNVLMCRLLHAWVKPTDFCAWGERIDNE